MPRPGSVKSIPDARSLARSYTSLAVATLAAIARSPRCPPAARVAASTALLDRGWGKPLQEPGEGGEIQVIIRQLTEPVGEAKTIEHDDRPPQLSRSTRG